MFLIVCDPGDPHGPAVRDALARRGLPVRLVDLAELPARATVAVRAAVRGGDTAPASGLPLDALLSLDGEPPLNLAEVRGVWWRRPRALSAHEDLWRPSHREFALVQWQETLAALWDALPVRWVNHPARGDAADRKPLQLAVAAACGLRVPRTVVTNDPAEARAFADAIGGPGRAVYKHLRAVPGVGRETQRLDREALARLDQVRYAPVILQEYVPGDLDLRVTVAGDTVFAAAIDARESAYPLDWRVDFDRARVSAAELPEDIGRGLRAVLERLGLLYGAFDLRRTPEGEHVFLEVNPFGRWTFVELRTGQPITDAVVDALVGEGR